MTEEQKTFEINMDDFTLGELELIEEVTGQLSGEIFEKSKDQFGAKTLQAFALVALRRENPEATIDDAKAVKLSALFDDDSVDPKGAATSG